jgi:hypothetical protein
MQLSLDELPFEPRFARLLQYGSWSQSYAIEPLIDHQTFKFFNFTPGFCQLNPHSLPPVAEWSLAVNFVNLTPN